MQNEEKKEDKFIMDFLSNQGNFYLSGNDRIEFNKSCEIHKSDVVLYRVDEISSEDKAPRKEALENVLSAMKMDGINFIYLILGDELGVHFYYGLARNYSKEAPELSINEIGKYILAPSIRGNFRGSSIVEVTGQDKKNILSQIEKQEYYSMLEGVPGYVQDDEKFQGVDRLVDVMLGDEFGFMILASPMNYEELRKIESDLYDVYSKIVPLSKQSVQEGTSVSTGEATGTSESENKSTGESRTKGTNEGVSVADGTNEGSSTSKGSSTSSSKSSSNSGTSKSGSEQSGKNTGSSHSETVTKGGSESQGTSTSMGTSIGTSSQSSQGESKSNSSTIEFINKKAQEWIKYLDEVIMPRLDYGNGKGVFITCSFLFSNSKACLKKLENTAISLFSGETGNKVPLKASEPAQNKELQFLKNLQLPCAFFVDELKDNEFKAHSALSQFIPAGNEFQIGNWITTNELSMVAGLPKKDVVGLELKEEVEFGLNVSNEIKEENKLEIGKLVQSGNIIEKSICLDKENLDKHIFITGVTGSGKTTTCQNILVGSDLPFLVIEPAKTEYRILKEKYEDLLVFTLGKDTVAPFRLNPFEFYPHESITSRVDMIQASIEASFEMEAAIPQIIESAIYDCYEDCGWNILTNKNKKYGEHAFDDGIYAFPTLEDLIHKVEKVVIEQGFDERLKNDYIGSIKARLQGLLVGAKGTMLNVKRSIDFRELLNRRVVLELEEIRSGTEKSLIMGFVLTNLMEAIKANYFSVIENNDNSARSYCRHITLVEEAHRLLSKYVPGDSPNKKHGVETFSDMLAEIRKYGEGLMIADQIPNKLTPEVLKNTNTKIVHKLFAEDDKEAIGNTIVLEKEQKEFLSKLETGRAVVFTQGFHKAIQVQINQDTDTTSNLVIDEKELRDTAYGFYAEHYKKGIIPGTQIFEKKPSVEELENIFRLNDEEVFSNIIPDYQRNKKENPEYVERLNELIKMYSKNFIVRYLMVQNFEIRLGVHLSEEKEKEKQKIMSDFVGKYAAASLSPKDYRRFNDSICVSRKG